MTKIALIGQGKGADIIERYLTTEFESINYEIIGRYNTKDQIPNVTLVITISGNMVARRHFFKTYKDRKYLSIERSQLPIEIGRANIIFPNVHVDMFADIGDNNVISSGVIVNHHCKIGDGNLFAPGVMMAGSVTIGNNNSFGVGVMIHSGVHIGNDCMFADGAVISGSIKSGTMVKLKTRNGVGTGMYVSIERGPARV